MTAPARRRGRPPNVAERAEPRGIGSARAHDPLAREVKLLGALLGQVLVEQGGEELLELVERVRRATIERRQEAGAAKEDRVNAALDGLHLERSEALARSFSLYFQLANLAEEKHRIRTLRRRERAAPDGAVEEGIRAGLGHLTRSGVAPERIDALLGRLRLSPVLTAHPTEARRRTTLVALRRVAALLDRLDDPRLTRSEDDELRRGLREEITLLWLSDELRATRPTPLDEVRTAMWFFDETLFRVTPRLYRQMAAARAAPVPAGPGGPGPAFLRWGSWIGGDRDGNPFVTAAVTEQTLRIQADHLLSGYVNVAHRLMQTVSVAASRSPISEDLRARLERDAAALPDTARVVTRRFPGEPYREAFGYLAERLRRTRIRLVTGDGQPHDLASADELLDEVRAIQGSLAAGGARRAAEGSVQDLAWQVETFGFHLASLEVRQHAGVHRAALEVLRRGGDPATELPGSVGGAPVTPAEVLETFRAIARIQATFGVRACERYVVSFTLGPQDVLDVLELAWRAGLGGDELPVDVVPLFESLDALRQAGPILRALAADPVYRSHLGARGRRQEVMLGYSDSTKESGFLAAAWALYRAQVALVGTAREAGIRLSLFHGRGGAIGRGGGPMTRAILAQPPGSVDAEHKVTEQGEVIAARYANRSIALRQLEQLTYGVLVASGEAHKEVSQAAEQRWQGSMDELAELSRDAYRSLVWDDPAFEGFFHAVTPIQEIAALNLGSRPAARGTAASGAAGSSGAADASAAVPQPPPLASVRAIPWVFAWSQSRANLPGWYGLGTALRGFRERHGDAAADALREMYASWPFFASTLDNAEMSLAKADIRVAAAYARLAHGADARRLWGRIEGEHALATAELLRVNGRTRLLENLPVLRRAIDLRNPYVDSLSELQVRLLARYRAAAPDDPERGRLLRLIQATVSGIAAGVQNTG